MTVTALKKVKENLLETKKETEALIDKMAHEYTTIILMKDSGILEGKNEEADEIIAGLLAQGTIANKTKIAIEKEIGLIDKAIEELSKEEEGKTGKA